MTRSGIYEAIERWLMSNNLTEGYAVQYRFWNDTEGRDTRYLIVQQNGGGRGEEALLRDSFRLLLLSGENDAAPADVENRAEAIRQAMIDGYKTGCIISMQPTGGITAIKTEEGRYLFTISFQTIISR